MKPIDWISGLFKPTQKPVRRRDQKDSALVNELLGIGTSRDKLEAGCFHEMPRLSDRELSAAYYHDDVAKKIVADRAEEMFRTGHELDGDTGGKLAARAKALGLNAQLLETFRWARLFGGAAMIIGADDGRPPWTALDPANVKDVMFLSVIDRRRLFPWAYYSNPLADNHGKVELFRIGPALGFQPSGESALIHESRMIVLDGTPVDAWKRQELAGWSYSVLQNPYNVIRQFETAFASAASLLSDASQGVFKIQGLIDMISSDPTTLQTRMMLVDMYRSSMRSIMLDADGEEFERVATSFAGIPDMLDKFMARMAAAADEPVSKLMGRAPQGLNTTGDLELRTWYDSVENSREKELKPALEKFYKILSAGKYAGEVEFCPLYEPTQKERAETEKLEAETDKLYVDMGAVQSEAVALARWGDKPFKETIDVPALEQSLKAEIDLAVSQAGKPEPPPVIAPGKPAVPPPADG